MSSQSLSDRFKQRVFVGAFVFFGVFFFYTTAYVRPNVTIQTPWLTPTHGEITITNHGGGFHPGAWFNPDFTWSTQHNAQWSEPANDPSVHFSPLAGRVPAGTTVHITITVDPGACPANIAFTQDDGRGIANISPFHLVGGVCQFYPIS